MRRRSSTKRPPEPTFFADRNLGKEFCRRLREEGFKIEIHDDHFAQDTDDVTWIAEVTRRRWVIFTNDKRIGFNDREIDALMQAGGKAYLPKGRMHPEEFAEWIIKSRVQINRHIKHQKKARSGPYMAKLCRSEKPNKPASIEKWIDRQKWQEKMKKRKGRRDR